MNFKRIILHSDMNNFFASVSMLNKPELKDKPVAICGDPTTRHGIILAKNEIAKKYGISTGEPIWNALKKCNSLIMLPPEFDKYRGYSKRAFEIYYDYTDLIEPFGIDEGWLDVTGSEYLFGSGFDIAELIRKRIKAELGLTVSIGVSFNKAFAKLASDMKKPDAVTCISPSNFRNTVWRLPISDLLFAGRSTTRKLNQNGYFFVGDLARAEPDKIRALLGKNGIKLWQYANGLDNSPVLPSGQEPILKSVSNGITLPEDITSAEDAKGILHMLSEKVSYRLYKEGLWAKVLQLNIKDNKFKTRDHRIALARPTFSSIDLFDAAYKLVRNNMPELPIRSLTVTACSLTSEEYGQLSIFQEEQRTARRENIDSTVFEIRNRYGKKSIRRASLMNPAVFKVHEDNEPIGFYKKQSPCL